MSRRKKDDGNGCLIFCYSSFRNSVVFAYGTPSNFLSSIFAFSMLGCRNFNQLV